MSHFYHNSEGIHYHPYDDRSMSFALSSSTITSWDKNAQDFGSQVMFAQRSAWSNVEFSPSLSYKPETLFKHVIPAEIISQRQLLTKPFKQSYPVLYRITQGRLSNFQTILHPDSIYLPYFTTLPCRVVEITPETASMWHCRSNLSDFLEFSREKGFHWLAFNTDDLFRHEQFFTRFLSPFSDYDRHFTLLQRKGEFLSIVNVRLRLGSFDLNPWNEADRAWMNAELKYFVLGSNSLSFHETLLLRTPLLLESLAKRGWRGLLTLDISSSEVVKLFEKMTGKKPTEEDYLLILRRLYEYVCNIFKEN